MFEIEVIDAYEQFRRMEPCWDGLIEGSDADSPFMTFEWLSSWWESFGKEQRMLVLLVKRSNDVVAIVPWMRSAVSWRHLPVTAVNFISNYLSERNGMVLKENNPRILDSLFNYLRSRYRYDLLILEHVVKGSVSERALALYAQEMKPRCLVHRGNAAPYIEVNASWETYYRGLPKNFRSRMNNIGNILNRSGACDIVRVSSGDIERAMQELLDISRRTWKFANGTAIANHPDTAKFYTLLAHRAAAKGWLDLWFLKLDGKPIAFTFNLRRNGKVYGLKSGYDETYRRMAPSRYLNQHTIRECFQLGMREYDLLGKNDPFKMKWASRCREHCTYILFNDTVYGRALSFVENAVVQPLKRFSARTSVPSAAGDVD